jgi:hypothetical protein
MLFGMQAKGQLADHVGLLVEMGPQRHVALAPESRSAMCQ